MANGGESATHTGKSRRQRVRLVAKLAKARYFHRDDEALLRRAWRYARLVARKDLALPNPASEADQALAGFVASTADSRSYGESRVVAEALDALAVNADPFEIRDRARGIRALASGLTDPADQVHRDLLSLAARHLDGGHAALSSLAAPSSTWLGSLESEALLRASIVEAERRFREYPSSQGGIEEEASTAILVDSLRQSVSGVQGRLSALGGRGRRVPDLRLTYRQIPKKEESSYGCDIAFVVTIRRASTLLLEAAELVQVKKPSRGSASLPRPLADRFASTSHLAGSGAIGGVLADRADRGRAGRSG